MCHKLKICATIHASGIRNGVSERYRNDLSNSRYCKDFAQKIQEHIHLLRALRDSDRLRVRIAEGTENTENTENTE